MGKGSVGTFVDLSNGRDVCRGLEGQQVGEQREADTLAFRVHKNHTRTQPLILTADRGKERDELFGHTWERDSLVRPIWYVETWVAPAP